MGVVYLATQEKQPVALKVIRGNFVDDPSLSTRFTREIKTLQKLDSPFSGGTVIYESTKKIAFPRKNEKSDLSTCASDTTRNLRADLKPVTSLDDSYTVAYDDARLITDASLTYDIWASRIRKARDLFRPSVDAAAAVSTRSWGDESLDSAIQSDVAEAQSQLDELSSSASWTAGYTYGPGAPRDQWDAMWNRLSPWNKGFGSRTTFAISPAAKTICETKIY